LNRDLVLLVEICDNPRIIVAGRVCPRPEYKIKPRVPCLAPIDGGDSGLTNASVERFPGPPNERLFAAGALGDLMRALVECRIKPYYLHHGDLAPGTAHLRSDIATGQDLMRVLRGRFSGLCQPTYMLDIPGGHGKSPIGPNYLGRADDGHLVEDFNGRRHRYPPSDACDLVVPDRQKIE